MFFTPGIEFVLQRFIIQPRVVKNDGFVFPTFIRSNKFEVVARLYIWMLQKSSSKILLLLNQAKLTISMIIVPNCEAV